MKSVVLQLNASLNTVLNYWTSAKTTIFWTYQPSPFIDVIYRLGCPGQGPASGSPRRGPRPFGGRAGRGQYFRPSGCIGAGPRSLLKRQGRSVLAMSRPRPSSTCIKFIFTRIQQIFKCQSVSFISAEFMNSLVSERNSNFWLLTGVLQWSTQYSTAPQLSYLFFSVRLYFASMN